jgi:hypothetical protein
VSGAYRDRWTHGPACPGAHPDAWWAQGDAAKAWRCPACGAESIARDELYPVVVRVPTTRPAPPHSEVSDGRS